MSKFYQDMLVKGDVYDVVIVNKTIARIYVNADSAATLDRYKNPKTGKVIVVNFGDVKGGLTSKINDPEARKKFANRHNCKDKKDKTKAGYWACRVNRYANLWNGQTYPGFW